MQHLIRRRWRWAAYPAAHSRSPRHVRGQSFFAADDLQIRLLPVCSRSQRRRSVRAMRKRLGAVRKRVGAVRKKVGAVRKRVGAVRKRVGAVRKRVGA
eukprot:3312092-Rhodomonas_salina.1